MISINLQYLYLGELDLDTFNNFIQFYHSEEYIQNSQLKYLYISLNKTLIKFRECKNQVIDFFSGKNPLNLIQITFKSYFRIKRKNLYNSLKSSNGNNIQKYNFIMKIDKLKKYKHITEHKEFYFMNNEINKQIMLCIPVLKNFDFFQEKNKKIAKNIIKFLVPNNSKNINIKEIQ